MPTFAKPINFDQWVSDNNPPLHLEYGKGWWDYIEIVRRLADKFTIDDIAVVGTYVIETPPPEEKLTAPAIRLRTDNITFTVKYDFGKFPEAHHASVYFPWPTWLVSVSSVFPGPAKSYGLFGVFDYSKVPVDGFDVIYGPFSKSYCSEFTCMLEDELDLACLMRLFLY